MPKRYSDQEKTYIISRLKEEAAKCMAQYGIRRTTVDELVRRVKIPKGTFYLFFPSKELLLFEVILEQHETIEAQLFSSLATLDPKTITCGQLTDMLFGLFKAAEEMPILNMIHSDEIEILTRKLPQDVVEQHLSEDISIFERLFSTLLDHPSKNPEVFGTAFRNIYFATLHKNELDDPHYDEALKLLINGLVIQLLQ